MSATHCGFCRKPLNEAYDDLPENRADFGGMCIDCVILQPAPKQEDWGGPEGIIAKDRERLELLGIR